MKDIKSLESEINKEMGETVLMPLSKVKPIEGGISSGSCMLNIALSGSPFVGYVPGRIVEIYGPEQSGKTTMSLHAIREAQRLSLPTGFIDAEHALDINYARNLGVDLSKLSFCQPDYGERALEVAEKMVEKGYKLIVIDSVAALVPKSELEGQMGDAHMGKQARMMGQAMRKLTGKVSKNGALLIFINQIRMKLGLVFGCFDYNSRVNFADGTSEKIGKVVNQKINKLVLSVNKKGEIVSSRIKNWFNNGLVDFWLQVVVDKGVGNGRSQFKVTPDHLMLTFNGEVPMRSLKVGDRLLRKEKWLLNEDQIQIVIGSILGDGHLKKSLRQLRHEVSDCSPILGIQHSSNLEHQKLYCKWKHGLFGDAANTFNKRTTSFYTKPLPEFRKFTRESIIAQMDCRALAICYMDDGTFTKLKNGDSCTIYKKWPKEDLELLYTRICALTKAKGHISVKLGRITFCTAQMRKFQDAIAPYMYSSMFYKLYNQGKDVKLYSWDIKLKIRAKIGEGIIRSIKKVYPKNSSQKYKYDLEIEKNHCYCVDGIFVHNSPEETCGGKALKFYASYRLDVRSPRGGATKEKSLEGVNAETGIITKIKIVKNKVYPPYRTADLKIVYGKGIDKGVDLVDCLNYFDLTDSIRYNGFCYNQKKLKAVLMDPENVKLRKLVIRLIKSKFNGGIIK